MDTEKLVQNSVLTLAARAAMIAATGIGLPVAGFLMMRVVTAADAISKKVDDGALEIKLLQATVNYGFENNKADIATVKAQIADHETRLRTVERAGVRNPN